MRRQEVADAIRSWGLRPKKVVRVRAAFRVRTPEGTFCLKEVDDSEERLRFYDSVLRYVRSQGFTMLAPYIPTLTGECFAQYNEKKVVLLPWLAGNEISYTSAEDIAAAAEVLARFHRAAEGYEPEPGIRVKDKLGKWPEKLSRKVADLEEYREKAEKGYTEFDRYFLRYADWIYRHTADAARRICHSSYDRQVEESRERLTICHGDPSKRNFIRDRSGRMYLIDFESMKSDLPILDFWRLLRRTLARDMWDFAKVKLIIDGYNRGRTLSPGEYELLGILLTFPEKIWRIVHDYYEPGKKQGWTTKRFIRHLRRQVEQIGKMEHFLAKYHAVFLPEGMEEVRMEGEGRATDQNDEGEEILMDEERTARNFYMHPAGEMDFTDAGERGEVYTLLEQWGEDELGIFFSGRKTGSADGLSGEEEAGGMDAPDEEPATADGINRRKERKGLSFSKELGEESDGAGEDWGSGETVSFIRTLRLDEEEDAREGLGAEADRYYHDKED